MNDENLNHVAPETAQLNQTSDDAENALISKIARLPHDIREDLNRRLYDGKTGPEILAWLNELPTVKDILKTQFDGVPVNHENLSNWRHNGYQRWLQEKQNLSSIKELGKYAGGLTEAAAGQLAPAAAAAASDKILECLDAASAEDTNPDNIVKYAVVASDLAKTEQNNARIKIANERLRQRELLILLKRDKQQRDSVAHGLRLLGDARARLIESSSATYAEKIELLGIHMYGDDWEPRLVPVPGSPESPSSCPN